MRFLMKYTTLFSVSAIHRNQPVQIYCFREVCFAGLSEVHKSVFMETGQTEYQNPYNRKDNFQVFRKTVLPKSD